MFIPSGSLSYSVVQILIAHCQYLQGKFGVRSIRNNHYQHASAVYLQVSIVSQAPFMECILLKARNSSMIRATTESNLILLNRRRCALRSLCNNLRSFRFSPLTISFLSISVFINSTRGLFLFQAEGASDTQGSCGIIGETQGTWHWDSSTTLHCLNEKQWVFSRFFSGEGRES